MSSQISESIYQALADIRLIDPHTHINPHDPASHTLADLLGYHYYTELAHSAGMPKAQIEDPSIGPKELVSRLVQWLPTIENTAQYRWLVELCRNFYGFDSDRIDSSNWEELYDLAEDRMKAADWADVVLGQSNVEAVFLTNDFDDALAGFDTDVYIPCLRTDELVFHLSKKSVQQRLEKATGVDLDGSLSSLREALTRRFEHFVSRGARACAISLPPGFMPTQVTDGRAATALDDVLTRNEQADSSNRDALSRRVFWTLAELCDEFGLPFDLMIGVNRGVYAGGVYQGQDLYDSRVSLIQYRELFNAFPGVKFPISVLASVTNQELVSYSWIFPNVITNGHWWYSNTPSFIARDAAVRLEAVPQTKQIAYYSDAYKLEFVWPKFDMYRRTLANLLANNFVQANGWSEERAVELGRQVLRTNVDEIFPRPDTSRIRPAAEQVGVDTLEAFGEPTKLSNAAAATGVAGVALAAQQFLEPEFGDVSEVDEVELVDDVQSTLFDDNETFSDAATVIEELDAGESSNSEGNVDDVDIAEDNDFATLMIEPGSELEDDAATDFVPPASEIETVGDVEEFAVDSVEDSASSFETLIPDDFSDDVELADDVVIDADPLDLDSEEMIPGAMETVVESLSDDDFLGETLDAIEEVESPKDLVELEDTVDLPKPDAIGVASAGDHSDDLDPGVDTFGAFETIIEDEVDVDEAKLPAIEDTMWSVDAPDDVPEKPVLEDTLDLDSVPNDDEVKALPLDDVVLNGYAAELVGLDAEKIEAELESEPLDVGDLMGDEAESASVHPEIRMLRGEDSFSPDEDSLQMTSDPSTGELVFPVDTDSKADSPGAAREPATGLDDVDEWDIDEDQIDDVIGSSEDSDPSDAPSATPMDDDDWFADLSDLMGEEKSKSESSEDSKE